MNEAFEQLMGYARGIWRRRWMVLGITWLVCIVGWVSIYLMKNEYRAEARLYVDTQSLLKPLLTGMTIQPNLEQRIDFITRTLFSRPNLEKVARMTDLDIQAKDTRETEEMYRDMAARISISGTSRENLYTIAYVHPNPELGKRIVQAFLTIFTESSLGGTRADLTSSQKFLEDQIKNYEAKLNEKNEQLEEFKRRNYGALPAVGGGDFYAEVSQTDAAINQAKLEMEEAVNRMKQLQQQLADQDELLEMPSSQPTAATSLIDSRITALQTQIDNLRLRFTDMHPDIIRTKQLIAALQEQKRQEEAQKAKETTTASAKIQNPLYQQLSIAIAEADAHVAALKARIAQLERKKRDLAQSIDRIPQLQKEYADLMRDYDIYKSNYSQFLARKETAVLSGEVETKTDVVEFRVVDPPRASSQPVKPNRPLLISLVPAGGLACGVGLAFVLAQLRPTVDGRRQLQKLTGLQLLGTVTRVVTDSAQRRARRNHWVFAGASATLLLVYASLMTYYMLISPAA